MINNLRLWDVEIPEEYELDYPTLEARRRVKKILLPFFIQMIQQLKVKKLRLVQEYFMTSAGLQTIIKSYLKMGLPLKDIHEKYLFTSMIPTLRLHQLNLCVFSLMNMVFHGKMLGMRLLRL